jgi:uncharacterized protein YfaS (alpha-2-macroglobulin family)
LHTKHHLIRWLEQEVGLRKMTAPTNVTISADKPQYNAGDTVTLDISWASGEQVSTTTFTVSVSVKNQNGDEADATATIEVATQPPSDTFEANVTDDGGHTWNVTMGDDGLSAVATTTV